MVYTRPGGCVTVTTPTKEFMRAACNGGDTTVAVLPIDEWVRRKTSQGHNEDAAYRHARAWLAGGCTTAEAWAIVRDIEPRRIWNDRTRIEVVTLAPELIDIATLPADRYFRDAWRRPEIGGPIYFDLPTCRLIQLRNAESAVKDWNKQAQSDDERAVLSGRLTNGPAFIEFDRRGFQSVLLKAETPETIRAVWPEGMA